MALLAEEGDLDLEGSRNDGQSDKPLFSEKRDKRSRIDEKRGTIRSLPWTKTKDPGNERPVKKGKQHSHNKSGSRTPPDSPRTMRGADKALKVNQPSPTVKGNRKSYCQLDDWSDEEQGLTVSNEPALAASPLKTLLPSHTPHTHTELPPSTHTVSQLSPTRRTTVQFPVLFGEGHSPNSSRSGLPLLTDLSSTSRDPLPPPPTHPSTSHSDSPPLLEPDWSISNELREKCVSQFRELSATHGLLSGDKARQFFVKSKLPNQELSAIWRLADMDQDNALSESEFLVAMKLVLMRRKGHDIPLTLPDSLLSDLRPRSFTNNFGRQTDVCEENPNTPTNTLAEEAPVTLIDTTFGTEAPVVNTLVDIEGEAPVVNTHVDIEGEAPIVNTLVDIEGEAPFFNTLGDVGGEGPVVNTLIDIGRDSDTLFDTSLVDIEGEASLFVDNSLFEGEDPVVDDNISEEEISVISDNEETVLMQQQERVSTDSPGNTSPTQQTMKQSKQLKNTEEILINIDQGTPQIGRKSANKYQPLDSEDSPDGDWAKPGGKGHSRGKSLDIKKMITGQDVLEDLPSAEPPKLPPRPHQSPPLEHSKNEESGGRVRSQSTGSITKQTPPLSSSDDTNTSQNKPKTRKLRAAPQRPPPPVKKPESKTDGKKDLQISIKRLKDQNAGLTEMNKNLETQLFKLMEERIRLERQLELVNMP